MSKKVIITRKIELRYNLTDANGKVDREAHNKFHEDIKRWQAICHKAANKIANDLFVMANYENFIYMTELGKRKMEEVALFEGKEKEELKEVMKLVNKDIYKTIEAQHKEIFKGSVRNAYYQLLSNHYLGECPSTILSALSSTIFKTFMAEKVDVLHGKKSLRSYRADIPIPITAASITKVKRSVYKGKETKDFAFVLHGHPLRTNFGIDKSGNEKLMRRAFSSYFLPQWVHEAENELSDIIIHHRAGVFKDKSIPNTSVTLDTDGFFVETFIKERPFKITKSLTDDKEYRVETTNNDNPLFFTMIEQKITIKDEKTGKAKLDENGKKVRGVRWVITDDIKLCDSSIQRKKEQIEGEGGTKKYVTKIFLLATLEMYKETEVLDEDRVAEVYLSTEAPLLFKCGDTQIKIGTKVDFEYRRLGIQGAYQDTQKALRQAKGGRGRKRKLKGLERYREYEKNVVKLKVHEYTRKLIDLCVKFECKYLHLVDIKRSKKEAEENPYIMRNYSYGSFSSHISTKAEAKGIVVIQDKEEAEESAGTPEDI